MFWVSSNYEYMDFNEYIMNDLRIKYFLSENVEKNLHLSQIFIIFNI